MATKTNKWWFIAYPESLPSDWLDILEYTGLKFIVSPLHSLDVDENHNPKKHHYHIILYLDSPTTYKHIFENVVQPVHGAQLKPIIALKGAFDYLTHKNNPRKAQYDSSQILFLNGAEIADIHDDNLSMNAFEVILTLINDENITNFRSLVHRCRDLKDPFINQSLIGNCYFWRSYLYDK